MLKLIFLIIVAILVVVFIGFNLSNVCSVWLFYTFKNIPVCMPILISFVLGILIMLPFVIAAKGGATKVRHELKLREKELKDAVMEKMPQENPLDAKAKKARAKASKVAQPVASEYKPVQHLEETQFDSKYVSEAGKTAEKPEELKK